MTYYSDTDLILTSAGGGGAGGNGINGTSSAGGNAGDGLEVNIIGGTGNYYAGGGGGGIHSGKGSASLRCLSDIFL